MRRLKPAEREFLLYCTRPCELGEGDFTPLAESDHKIAASLRDRQLITVELCSCGNSHYQTTPLGREALRVEDAVAAIEGRSAA